MAKLILYGLDLSPPVRFCQLTLEALNIPYELKVVNLLEKEQHTTEFKKLNPMKTVPVLVDNGNVINDSHAISAYLVDKYGKSDELYPKDLLARARVNSCLFFDTSMLFQSLRNISLPLVFNETTIISKEKVENVRNCYVILETLLTNNEYMAGSRLTIADLSSAPLVTSMNGLIPIDVENCPNIIAWLSRLSKVPYFDKINAPFQKYVDLLKSKTTEIQL